MPSLFCRTYTSLQTTTAARTDTAVLLFLSLTDISSRTERECGRVDRRRQRHVRACIYTREGHREREIRRRETFCRKKPCGTEDRRAIVQVIGINRYTGLHRERYIHMHTHACVYGLNAAPLFMHMYISHSYRYIYIHILCVHSVTHAYNDV